MKDCEEGKGGSFEHAIFCVPLPEGRDRGKRGRGRLGRMLEGKGERLGVSNKYFKSLKTLTPCFKLLKAYFL